MEPKRGARTTYYGTRNTTSTTYALCKFYYEFVLVRIYEVRINRVPRQRCRTNPARLYVVVLDRYLQVTVIGVYAYFNCKTVNLEFTMTQLRNKKMPSLYRETIVKWWSRRAALGLKDNTNTTFTHTSSIVAIIFRTFHQEQRFVLFNQFQFSFQRRSKSTTL
jgi:hypothetical protein